MIGAVIVALAAPTAPTVVTPVMAEFDLARVKARGASCADAGQSDEVVVCARKAMQIWVRDPGAFADKPLRPEFKGPLNAEATFHVIQVSSPAASSPAAAVTLKWHF